MAESTVVPVEVGQQANSPDEFIRQHIGAAEQAWNAHNGREVLIRLGKLDMAIRFIGSDLEDVILPVLRHAIVVGPVSPNTVVYAVA